MSINYFLRYSFEFLEILFFEVKKKLVTFNLKNGLILEDKTLMATFYKFS